MKKKILSLLLAATMLCAGLTGCGSTSDTSGTSGTSGDTVASTEAVSGTAKDTIHIAYNAEPETFDPVKGTAIATRTITRNVFEGLLEMDADYNVQCQLAESYDVNEDSTEFTFYLRKGVKFHNGKEMTADDVVASLNYWADFKAISYFENGERFEKVDDYTVKITFSSPSGMFPYAMVDQTGFAAIMPAEVIESASETGVSEYIGTGPYKFTEYVSGEYVKLDKYEDYVGPDFDCNGGDAGNRETEINTVYYDFVTDSMTRLAGVNTGEYDVACNISYDNLSEIEAYGLKQYADWSMLGCIFMNQSQGAFMDKDLRKAVRLAIDPNAMMAAAIPDDSFYNVSGSFAGTNFTNWYVEDAESYITGGDIETAKALVEGSSYDGSTIKLVTTSAYPDMEAMTMVLQQTLQEIGLNVEVETLDWATTLTTLWNYEPVNDGYDIYIMCYPYSAAPSSSAILTLIYSCAYADLDAIADDKLALDSATSDDEKYEAWKNIQQTIFDEEMFIKFYDEASITISTQNVTSMENFSGPVVWTISAVE